MGSSTVNVNMLFASMDVLNSYPDPSDRDYVDLRITSSDNCQRLQNSIFIFRQWKGAFADSSAIPYFLDTKAKSGGLKMAIANCEMKFGAE